MIGTYTLANFNTVPDGSGGTLITDPSNGSHSANIALLTHYMASSFATAGYGHGSALLSPDAHWTSEHTSLAAPHG